MNDQLTDAQKYEQQLEVWRKYFELFKSKPDLFLDFIADENCKIQLHFYQRIFLRVIFRHKKVFFTFTRGTAKSWTAIMAIYLRCIFFPGAHYFICAPGKEQASKIAKENIEKIWSFYPILKDEIDFSETRFGKDYTEIKFLNGSKFDVVHVGNSSRGGRRNGGLIEEICDPAMKKDILNEVVIPLMANDRISNYKNEVDPNEIHKFEVYVTTASTKQSFAYEKLQEVLYEMSLGKSAFVLGAGYELPCLYPKQMSLSHINEIKSRPTFNPLSFAREYESIYTGTTDRSLVSQDNLRACRNLSRAETKYTKRKGEPDPLYILAYDVARKEGNQNADSALSVLKLIPRGDGTYRKFLVNLFSFDGESFKEQAKKIKQKVADFKAHMLVVDANGAGVGLIDELIKEIDDYPSYAVVNDKRYDKYRTPDSIPILYALSSNTKEDKASIIHNTFISHIQNQKVQMLISESEAKIMFTKDDKKLSSEELQEKLVPYILTDHLCEEIMNLEYQASGNQTQVKQISKRINKDKFSSFEYAIHYSVIMERENLTRKSEKIDFTKFFQGRRPMV